MPCFSTDFKICQIVLFLTGQFMHIGVFSVKQFDRKITQNMSWIEEDLFEYPQLKFEIKFEVSFPLGSCCPILDISSYDRVEHTGKQCFSERVGTESVWLRGVYKLKPSDQDKKETDISCEEEADGYYCVVTYKALFFEPKKVRYIIGYECSEMPNNLKGMKYVFDFTTVSNTTNCKPIDVSLLSVPCNDYYLWTASPNLLGHQTQNDAATILDIVTLVVTSLKDPAIEPCYKYLNIFLCGIFFPPCITWDFDRSKIPRAPDDKAGNTSVVTVNRLFSACREMCEEFARGCGVFLAPIISVIECSYYPSFNESDTCVWDRVTCPGPPTVEDAVFKSDEQTNYSMESNVEYQCEKEHSMKGPATITCKPSGYWSDEPECINDTPTTVKTIVSVLCIVVVVTLVVFIRRRRNRDKEETTFYPKRNRPYDGFISYFSEGSNSDRRFVRQVLQPRLEEQAFPPFRLLFHERDFRADMLIYANILDAIRKSNCAIVIMSQEYVNSAWCREEFEEFMEEQKKDPAFRLFVIMMQEHETLHKCSVYMKKYFRTKTYFEKNDPDLWPKIERELMELKGNLNTIEVSV